MEILEKLLRLVVDKVPVIAAEVVFAIFSFILRPYRAVVRAVIFARRNGLPTQLFVALSFTLFMLAFGFSRPFAEFNVLETVSQVSMLNNKTDLFYVILYSVGLTSLVAFMHLCIETISSVRYRVLFRDFYFVSVALAIPWSATIFTSAMWLASGIPESWTWIGWAIVFSALAIATAPTLVFAIQADLRWNLSSPLYSRVTRILPVYGCTLVILVLMPLYFYYLGSSLYQGEPVNFAAACFTDNDVLYVAVGAENRSQKTEILDAIQVKAVAIDFGGAGNLHQYEYLFEVADP